MSRYGMPFKHIANGKKILAIDDNLEMALAVRFIDCNKCYTHSESGSSRYRKIFEATEVISL
jgi:hypothetical protein